MVRVEAGARLHFGFGNLSLSHERLYGALGMALDYPTMCLRASPAEGVVCDDPTVRRYAERAVELLSLPGVAVSVESSLPRHVGLGSGTTLALATLAAAGRANDRSPDVRSLAPALGRGGRSGVGVAAFEAGGFVLDAGHPTERFTTDRPSDGDWSVPPVAARHRVPEQWRFLVVIPSVDPGRSGEEEDQSIRAVIERADPTLSDRIAGLLTRRLLPSIAEGDPERFGAAVAEVSRLNGAWYADQQGGVYRPPVGELVTELSRSPAVYGAGQSSWGPVVFGVTDAERADEAHDAGVAALDAAGVDGVVHVARGRNHGAVFDSLSDPVPAGDDGPA
ncbi:MAG: beta-ribofuranosylaminobenzene 5'-phosphate synthase family protein [Halobacteriota archaeon]